MVLCLYFHICLTKSFSKSVPCFFFDSFAFCSPHTPAPSFSFQHLNHFSHYVAHYIYFWFSFVLCQILVLVSILWLLFMSSLALFSSCLAFCSHCHCSAFCFTGKSSFSSDTCLLSLSEFWYFSV